MRKRLKIPPDVLQTVKRLRSSGFEAFVVGGAVRDGLMRKPCKDWDVTTNAVPKDVEKIFPKTVPTGKKYGTVTVLGKKLSIQVTTYRLDLDYKNFRHPRKVRFVKSLREDLARRDFTVNAIAYDPLAHQFIDPFDGRKDITRKRLRGVGDVSKRFKEDALRILRAGRLISQLQFAPDPSLGRAAGRSKNLVLKISKERVRDELTKLIMTEKPSVGFKWLDRTGVLKRILPELTVCKGVVQGGWHSYDVFYHTLQCLDQSQNDELVRLTLLFHDIAKPKTRTQDRKGYHFYRHDQIGAEMSAKILKRLKYSRQTVGTVSHLIRHHLFEESGALSSKGATRRFIQRIGVQNIEPLFWVREGDAKGCGKGRKAGRSLELLRKRIHTILHQKNPLSIRDLAIDGNEVMSILKISPGPTVGRALKTLLEEVLENPSMNDSHKLKKRLAELVPTVV